MSRQIQSPKMANLYSGVPEELSDSEQARYEAQLAHIPDETIAHWSKLIKRLPAKARPRTLYQWAMHYEPDSMPAEVSELAKKLKRLSN